MYRIYARACMSFAYGFVCMFVSRGAVLYWFLCVCVCMCAFWVECVFGLCRGGEEVCVGKRGGICVCR